MNERQAQEVEKQIRTDDPDGLVETTVAQINKRLWKVVVRHRIYRRKLDIGDPNTWESIRAMWEELGK